MSRHEFRVREVLAPGGLALMPRCECGWHGGLTRDRARAAAMHAKHIKRLQRIAAAAQTQTHDQEQR